MQELIPIKINIIHWACERAGELFSALSAKKEFSGLNSETDGYVHLTISKIEKLSKILRYPLAYFFLDSPVTEIDKLEINDFRTHKNSKPTSVSINLSEQIAACKNQQEWFRDYIIRNQYESFDLYKKYSVNESAEKAGEEVRKYLKIEYLSKNNPDEFLKYLREILEKNNVIVEISKVLKQTKYRLNVSEFRGFALADKYAPLIFVNGNDYVRAQLFTLCHELGHICLGLEGLSDGIQETEIESEVWCNKFAASLLMPSSDFVNDFCQCSRNVNSFIEYASKKYQISSFAILFRLLNLNLIQRKDFDFKYKEIEESFQNYLSELGNKLENEKSGGNFYNTYKSRTSTLFARAIISSAMVGETSFRDAMNLLEIKTINTFNKIAKNYGVN